MAQALNLLADHPKYECVSVLGSGTFGTVQLAKERATGKEVAIKFLALDVTFDKRYVQNEINNHRLLVHPHVVEFKEVFLTRQHLGIVMEYCSGGNLHEYVVKKGCLHEWESRWFYQQLVLALDYCHQKIGVVNRDLKLENLLLKSCSTFPVLKMCDFGYSKHLVQNSAPISRVGSPAYVAPEVLRNSEHGTAYDGEKADIWSSGVVLYVMLAGRYPFTRGGDMTFSLKIIRELTQPAVEEVIAKMSVSKKLSPPARALLSRILTVDPAKRIGLPEIMQDPWFCEMLPDLSSMRYATRPSTQGEAQVRAILEQAQVIAKEHCRRIEADMDLQDTYGEDLYEVGVAGVTLGDDSNGKPAGGAER